MKASTSDAKIGAALALIVILVPRGRPHRVYIRIVNHEVTVILEREINSNAICIAIKYQDRWVTHVLLFNEHVAVLELHIIADVSIAIGSLPKKVTIEVIKD